MRKEQILGYDICIIKEQELLESIFNDLNMGKQNFIVNVNPEIIVQNYKDKQFVAKLNEQQYQIPDGIGIVMASKIMKGNIRNRITGIDFMDSICKQSTRNNGKIFLYGAKPEIVQKASIELKNKYSDINIVGCYDGYSPEDIAIQKIKDSKANILFVALGTPKQEKFILNNMDILDNIKIFLPVGGSFDVISNKLKRAPDWIIKLNLEWLYRLIKQPWRLFRQLRLIKFIILVIKEKRLKGYEKN